MSISWTTPAAFWFGLVIPLAWFVLRYARTNFNPRQRRLQALIRSALLGLIVLALARPVISSGSSQLSVVYVVDVSHSVAPGEILKAAGKIDELNAAVRPAYSRIIAFGRDAASVESTVALRGFGTEGAPPPAAVNRLGTDVDGALTLARASLTPGALPRIVLFSDGRATSGDTNAAIARLHADGVPVSVVSLSPPDLGDTWIDAIDVPERISSGGTFSVAVHLTSQRAGNATVELRALGKVIATRTATLAIGANQVTLDAALESIGAQAIEATVTKAGDPVPVNNRLDRVVLVGPRPKVLYVEGAGGNSSRYLNGALTAAGIDVALRSPSNLALDSRALEPFDVAILSDVTRSSLSEGAMRSLAEWVETGGGGLLIAGGENVFGEGPEGYRKTELERIAPVTFERRDEPEIALVIVLDKSFSMNGSVMELCKAAAQAAIDALADRQSVGVITFNDGYSWDVPVQNVGKNRDKIRKAVSAIQANGQTLIFPALEQAYKALSTVKARAKHVVLLSDGRSYPDDYETLVKKMVAGKMTVSSIAVGKDADADLLSRIANWGKGRHYLVEDANEVPQIFVKEAKEIPNVSFDEKPIELTLKHKSFLTDVDVTKAPALKGRTATVIKDSAIELLTTKDGDPILAFWQAGLGRTALFAPDVKDRWASNWVSWRGYGPFFASIVRALERRRPPAVELTIEPGAVHGAVRTMGLSLDAHDAEGKPRDFLAPKIRVQSGTRAPVEISARQTAPGHYEARAIVDAAEPFAAAVVGSETGITSGLIVPDANEEYRFRPADEPALRSIAEATGGHWNPTAAVLANTAGEHRATRRPLWPALLWAALILWMADLVLRRVRVFERV
ncbi:MAG: VWA domain-containing protein [Acidobacteria bacterium]|nr:MAG: VWA domain-containing protein [Acidobacteriota bacterium]